VLALAPTIAPQEAAGAALSPTAAPTAAPDAPIVAEVSINAGDNRGSWLQIKIDGQTVFQKVLGSGQSLPAFKAQRDFWIRAGNASVVSVVINGQKQCCTASPGEVQTFAWPPG
jgi:hypothetical protein